MEEFIFIYHQVETINPETGFRGQFGNSYTFTSEPTAPDQRTFKLSFQGMKFFFDENGDIISDVFPERNMKTLIEFYHEHKLHKNFLYNHPVHGNMTVKFNKPLPEPKTIGDGIAVVDNFEVELIEIP